MIPASLTFFTIDTKVSLGRSHRKNFLLFDSFKGLPPVEANSIDSQSLHVASGSRGLGAWIGLTASELGDLVSEILSPSDKFQIAEGYYDDVLADYPPSKLSIAHIYYDLCSSAKLMLH